MPLKRYLIRNEYRLGDDDLYRDANKDDPEALLEGVSMSGLVGLLRQLGDLAQFAAEMFHDLHEEVMATAARGHDLVARVQQLETEFPSMEKTLLSQTSHTPFLYNSGIDWHPSIRMDDNLVSQSDMPRFVMDSYEECRGPPRLYLLDKFDVAGAGACLKRYTDPSSLKADLTDYNIEEPRGHREKKIQKVKDLKQRRGPWWRNGDTPEAFPSSHAKLHQLLLEERLESGETDPKRHVKLKRRALDGFRRDESLKSYMQNFFDTCSPECKDVREISLDLVPLDFETNVNTAQSGHEMVEIVTVSPTQEPSYSDEIAYSSLNVPDMAVKSPTNEINSFTSGGTVEIPRENYENDMHKLLPWFSKEASEATEDLAADDGNKSECSAVGYNTDDTASELENFVDALATMDSDIETDSEYRIKGNASYLNGGRNMIDSDSSEGKQDLQNMLLDYHSVMSSTTSHNGSLLKEINSFPCSDNSNNIADSKPDCAAEGSKSSAVNILADVEKSVTVEAQQNRVEEYVASGVAENIGNSFLVEAELNDPTWSSVKVYTEMVRMDEKLMTRTNEDSKDQAVLHTLPSSGYGHPMPIGERPVHEMADAGSDTFADVSLEHSHVPDYTSSQIQLYSVKADESNETVNSFSVTSAGNPIDDLRKQVEEVSSDGLLVFQKSSPSVLYHPKPVLSDFENDTTSANEANSEDQLDRLSLVQDPEQPEGHMAGTSTPVDDHADRQSPAVETHYPPEDIHVGKTDSTETIEFDSSEFEVASTIDECREMTAPGSTEATGKTTTNMDGSIKMNLLVVSSKIFSDPNESLKMTDDHIFSDGQMAGADSHFTISSAEGLYTASPLYEVDPDFHADGVEIHNDSVAMDPDQLDLEPLRNSNTCLVDDVSGSLEAEGAASYKDGITDNNNRAPYPAATSNDSPSKHFPEGNSYLDLFNSATGLQHAGTKVADAGNVYLKVENTLAQRQSLSSVPNCSLMEYSDKQNEESLSVCEDAYENSKQSQISLQHRGEVDLQSPAIPRIDDFVNSDSSICHTSKGNCVLRMADAVHGTCLAEEALLPSVECDQHLERSNFVQHQVVEDLEHDLDALANANTKLRTAFSKAAETQDFDNTKNSLKSMEGASQSLEYAQGNVPLKDSGNEMCINPISVSCLFVEGEPATPSDSVSTHRQPLLVEIPEQSADDEEKRTGLVMEQSHEDLSSTILFPDEAKASMIVENAGQTVDLPQLGIPRFSTLSDPTHIKPQEMPPLPPIKWRLGRSPNTSVASKGIMQHALGIMRSNHAGLRSQKSVGAEHLNQFLSLSAKNVSFPHVVGYSGGNMEQPIGSTLSVPSMVHEGGQELSINADRRQDVQLCMVDEEDFPTSDRRMDDFSLKPLESGYATALLEQVFQRKTTTADVDQVEHVSSSAEQQTAVEDEQCKHITEQEFGSASAQFEPSFTMQYGHPLPQGFMDREAQGLWSADIYGTIKLENVNHTLQKKIPRPRNPLIDEVVALDKTKLRKVGERVKPQDKQEAEKLQQNLPQLRKVGERVKLPDAVKAEESHHSFPPLRKVGERTKQQDAVKTEGSRNSFPQLRKVGECAKRQDAVKTEGSHSSFPPLRKVGERVETRDERTTAGIAQHRPQLRKVVGKFESQNEPTEENTQYFLQLRKVAERVEHQDGQTTEVNTLYLPQLRKVGEKIKPEDESNAEESKQSFLPLRDDSGRLKSEDGARAEDKDSLLLQIRNKTFNLKPAVTSRPSVQGPQTNLKVAAILERASTIRQAMAGSDEEDSDGWGDN